ncbi:hypothetical protein [Parafrankia elaeagni]|uniref:hypothetical protein n=1 Tax=Parafrankia elaeagni TaxID=222534 RepID=UPI00036CABEA|nr:hypothetical protein [Parafrankia elaeagni]
MTRRGDRVPRPADPDKWDLFAADNPAGEGWDSLCRSHPSAARAAFDAIQRDPRHRNQRQHPLKGSLGTRSIGGRPMPQWQYEATGGGRIWYCIDDDRHRIWITHAGAAHPKVTE